MTFADAIVTKRTDRMWTQRELSRRSDVSNAEISRIEADKRCSSSIKTIGALADALNINVLELIGTALFDEDTQDWFNQQAIKEVCFCRCKKCGLFYKSTLKHKCR